MQKEIPINDFKYEGDGYVFQFKNQREAFYKTLVVSTRHLKVLENRTGLESKRLKEVIIEEWFADENEITRLENNAKRRAKSAK
jgi:hypothetical protein